MTDDPDRSPTACFTRGMATPDPTTIDEIPTPALVIEQSVFEANLAAMDAVRPGTELRPHVKAFKLSLIHI